MADDQLASLPSKAAFRLLRKKDLDELAVKNELAPSPSLDKVGLQAFLKEKLELEDYWQELKDHASDEREAAERQQDSERKEAQRKERAEKRQQDIEKEERLSKEYWAKRDYEAKETAKTREHELHMEQANKRVFTTTPTFDLRYAE